MAIKKCYHFWSISTNILPLLICLGFSIVDLRSLASLTATASRGRGTKYRQSWTWPNRGHAYEVLKCPFLLCSYFSLKLQNVISRKFRILDKSRSLQIKACYQISTVDQEFVENYFDFEENYFDLEEPSLLLRNTVLLLNWNSMSVTKFLGTLSPWITKQWHHCLPQWLLAGKASYSNAEFFRIKTSKWCAPYS